MYKNLILHPIFVRVLWQVVMFMGIVDTKIWPASHDLAVVYGCKNMYICLVKKGTSAPDFHDDAATRHSDTKICSDQLNYLLV